MNPKDTQNLGIQLPTKNVWIFYQLQIWKPLTRVIPAQVTPSSLAVPAQRAEPTWRTSAKKEPERDIQRSADNSQIETNVETILVLIFPGG